MRKAFLLIALLFVSATNAQEIPTNKPELVNETVNSFKLEAGIRGISLSPLANLLSIEVVPGRDIITAETISYSNGSYKILLSEEKLDSGWNRTRIIFHELGHVFGLGDCCQCRYNVMACNASARAALLFKDEYIRELYYDIFFEQIKHPLQQHKHY